MSPILRMKLNGNCMRIVVLLLILLINTNMAAAISSNTIQDAKGIRVTFKDAELYFNKTNGGEITEYYDLSIDPNKTNNLVNISIKGTVWGNLWPLFATGIYNPYNASAFSTGGYSKAGVYLRENSSSRIVLFTSSKISNLAGTIINDSNNKPVLVNTTWTFDKKTGLIFVERTIFIDSVLKMPSGWRWYPFYLTRSVGFKNNATYYMFNTTYTKAATINQSTYTNNYNDYPLFPASTNGVFGVAVPFSNIEIEGDGAHNIVITYNSDDLIKTEWRSDNYNSNNFPVTETGAMHEFSSPFSMTSHTYHAIVDFTHVPLNEQKVIQYAKYTDSIFPIFKISINPDKNVYTGETYTVDISGISYYNISLRPLLSVTYDNGSVYLMKDYGLQSYSKIQTFSDIIFGDTFSYKPYNLTFTIQLLSLINAIIAQDSKTISILPQIELNITTDKALYSPGENYSINVFGRVNQNLTRMMPKFTDEDDTGIYMVKYYPLQNYTAGEAFSYTIFSGTIPIDERPSNHTYTIQIISSENKTIAQDNTKIYIG